jgi:hypothetical protein
MQVNNHSFNSSRECLRYVYRHEGIKGVYKGVVPTALREIPSYGFQFATYEFLKDLLTGKDKKHLTVLEALCVGPLAALCSELFTYPQDVIKTRIQVNPTGYYTRNKYFNE